MIYQIYYKNEQHPREIMFDIELFKTKTVDNKWYLELHSNSFISGAICFILNKCDEEHLNFDEYFNEFKKNCNELEELPGWLFETKNNNVGNLEEVSKREVEYRKELEEKIRIFAKKYDLYIDID